MQRFAPHLCLVVLVMFAACGKKDKNREAPAPVPNDPPAERKLEPVPTPDETLAPIPEGTSAACRKLIETFGLQQVDASYKNFQGLQADFRVKFKVNPSRCISGPEGISFDLNSAVAEDPMVLTYIGKKVDGQLIFTTASSGNCTAVGPYYFINYLKNNNWAILEQTAVAIYGNYRTEACPAWQKAVTDTVQKVLGELEI